MNTLILLILCSYYLMGSSSSKKEDKQDEDGVGESGYPSSQQQAYGSIINLQPRDLYNSSSDIPSSQAIISKDAIGSPNRTKRPRVINEEEAEDSDSSEILPQYNRTQEILSAPLSAEEMDDQYLPPKGAIDIISYVQDVRFCRRSKQLKTFKSIKNKVLTRVSWALDKSQVRYRVTFQDLKIIGDEETPIVKPLITIITTMEGEFIQMDKRSKLLKCQRKINEGKVDGRDMDEVETELQLIWNIIRKGNNLDKEEEKVEGKVKIVSFREQRKEEQLVRRYRNDDNYNIAIEEDSGVYRWQIDSDEEERAKKIAAAQKFKYPSVIESISDYRKYMLFDHPTIPMIGVGNIFHTVIVGHKGNLKIDCYLKKVFVEPKWSEGLNEEQSRFMKMVYEDGLQETELEVGQFKRDLETELRNLNIAL